MNGDTNRSGHAGPGRRVAGAAPDQKVAPAANSTMEVAKPAEAKPTLAEMMAKATTHHEWGLVVAALSREIASARKELAELERGNEAAALAGLEANKAHLWEVFASTERVKQLVLTLGTAKEREGAAQTVEIDAKMIADARKAVEETLPRVKAKLRRIYDALMALPGLVDELVAELAAFQDLQAHASRRLEQAPTPELRELVIPYLRIRGEAAAAFPRPVLPASAPSPMGERDSIYIAAVLALDLIQKRIMSDSPHDAHRNVRLYSIDRDIRDGKRGARAIAATGHPDEGFGGLGAA